MVQVHARRHPSEREGSSRPIPGTNAKPRPKSVRREENNMKTRAPKWLFLIPLVFVFVLTAAKPAVAQDDGDDPPNPVGRLSYTHAEASFIPGGTGDWL